MIIDIIYIMLSRPDIKRKANGKVEIGLVTRQTPVLFNENVI